MAGTVNRAPLVGVDGVPAASLAWLFPLRCVVCGEAGVDGRDLCRSCHDALPWQGPACPRCALPAPAGDTCGRCLQSTSPLACVRAVFDYAFPLDRLLPRLKFHHDFAAGRVLVQCMAERLGGLPRPDAVVPVPLHRARLRRRGYDQALELARPLASALQLPIHTGLLQRSKATTAQSRLDADARQRNLRGAFAVSGCTAPEHVVLVDDVMTTGATLEAAARVLRQAGVQRVDAWVCARVA